MGWTLEEAVSYYRRLGAPGDQNAVISLLAEIQQEMGGSIPPAAVSRAAQLLPAREALLLALIRRIPRLRLGSEHLLELCAGPNCSKAKELAQAAEALARKRSDIRLKYVPCLRQCGKGPNLRWDGTLHNKGDILLLQKLSEDPK